jgi:endonuclease/exonuclease/phosphatase family metal-dependent hydrolase
MSEPCKEAQATSPKEAERGRNFVQVRLMTYNVHACVGRDGHRSEERIARVIAECAPDVVALQELEVDCPRSDRVDQPLTLAQLTNLTAHFTPAREDHRGQFGNAILSKFPFELTSEGSLPVKFGETRGGQRLSVRVGSAHVKGAACLDVVNTHLSIHLYERLLQVKALFSEQPQELSESATFLPLARPLGHLVLCGDLNAGSWSPVYRMLLAHLRDAYHALSTSKRHRAVVGRSRATWPASLPVLRLDHVWVGPELEVASVKPVRTSLTRVASDHLPVIADILVPTEGHHHGRCIGQPAGVFGQTWRF